MKAFGLVGRVLASLWRLRPDFCKQIKRQSKAWTLLLPIRRQREPDRRIPTAIIQNRQRENPRRQSRPINHPRARNLRHQLCGDLLQPSVCLVLSRKRSFRGQASDGRVREPSWERSHYVHIQEHLGLHDYPRGARQF